MAVSPGTRLGPYEILGPLGAGGMAEVYRARDPRLNREIAIKILPDTTAADPECRARFEREAQSLAALSHPNIVTIHSVEQADGLLFLTMEFVDGQPLSDLILPGGLPLDQALGIAIALADAVSVAHLKGITHRDLKPANVMIADGRVKVLDFGLAKLVEPLRTGADVTRLPTALTGEGRIVGTVAYMSPEQAVGKPVGHRSDIFSLGVMLYEMATGERPFTGDSSVSVLSSILKDTPPAVTDVKPVLPRELSRIVKHCLAKDPEDRYQSAKDLRNDLRELQREIDRTDARASCEGRAGEPVRRVGRRFRRPYIVATGALVLFGVAVLGGRLWVNRPTAGGSIDSLAVLPFVNVKGDPNAEYLSDGITENLINSFSQLPALRVVPRSTVFRYKGRELDFQKIGRELAVRSVLTGRVVQRGDALNIQAELVDITHDAQLWGHQYTRTFSDLITVQEEIATAVSQQLHLRPTTEERKRLTRRSTDKPEAHQLYLKGQYYWNRRSAQTLPRAAEAFQQAVDTDPGYGLAWAGLAACYATYGFYGVGSPREASPRAKEAALTALRIDETLNEAHSALGWIKMVYDWDWPGAEREHKRAIELNPHDGTTHLRYAVYWEVTGRVAESMAEAKRALEAEPLSLIIRTSVGRIFHDARQPNEAIAQLDKGLELDPNFAQIHLYLGWVHEQQGRYGDAIMELQKAVALAAGDSQFDGALGHAYAVSGKREEAEKAIAALTARSAQHYVAPIDIAVIYVGLGAKNSAFEWLEKAYEDRSTRLTWIKVDPRFDGVRDDPRYRDLLRRMRLPE